ncbi:MAG: maleylacetoacetate isomerase [Proteobacteria bacterium]|nr:maleylacetoacetate isomerase [Pseudomonadota bacterium]
MANQHEKLRLYSYWRSSAAYRVRIALNLKGLPHEIVPVHLLDGGGQQHALEYRAIQPQALVPALMHGHRILRQSMAIIEYIDETWPEPPLLPATARDRVRARALAQAIACDIHPLNNLRVMKYFENEWNVPPPEREEWVRHWIREGFHAVENMLSEHLSTGTFCDGELPGLADCCLIPQVFNARRFAVALDAYPTIRRIHDSCMKLPAFDAARPERQPDAPTPA